MITTPFLSTFDAKPFSSSEGTKSTQFLLGRLAITELDGKSEKMHSGELDAHARLECKHLKVVLASRNPQFRVLSIEGRKRNLRNAT